MLSICGQARYYTSVNSLSFVTLLRCEAFHEVPGGWVAIVFPCHVQDRLGDAWDGAGCYGGRVVGRRAVGFWWSVVGDSVQACILQCVISTLVGNRAVLLVFSRVVGLQNALRVCGRTLHFAVMVDGLTWLGWGFSASSWGVLRFRHIV